MGFAKLYLGNKLRLIRKDKGLSLENMAHDTGCSVATLSRLERGETEVDNETMAAIRKALNIEKAPLSEYELKIFRGKLLVWHTLCASGRKDEAESTKKELAIIKSLPFERGLYLLYTMIETRLLIIQRNIEAAQDKLKEAETCLDEMCAEARYLYYDNKGRLCGISHDNRNAIMYHRKALAIETEDLKTDISSLLLLVGLSYKNMGRYFHAILNLEQAKMLYSGDSADIRGPHIDVQLAFCYMKAGNLSKAKNLITAALAQARSINNNIGVGVALQILADIHGHEGDYQKALTIYDESYQYSPSNNDPLFNPQFKLHELYNKAYCLYNMKKFANCAEVLEQGKSLAKDDERYTLVFESIEHLMNLNNNKSAEYIETITIPYHRKRDELQSALFYCEKLEDSYHKKNSSKKANVIAAIARDIYKEMISDVDDTE